MYKFIADKQSGTTIGVLSKHYNKNDKQYLKAGRFNSRDNPRVFSIEPVIETICSELGKMLGISVAEVHIEVQEIIYKEENYKTFVGVSKDFMPTNSEKVRMSQIYNVNDYKDLLCSDNSLLLRQLLLFDYIIMNEDRHSKNLEWIATESGITVSPLFDHGFSLLYDDIKGMIKDFKKASRYCQTGDLFYGYTDIEKLIMEYCDKSMINWI